LRDAKKERERAEAGMILSEDGKILTVRKNSRGDSIEPLTYDLFTNRKVRGGLWWPDAHDADAEREIARDDKGFLRMVSDEIQRHIDAGAPANPEEEGSAVGMYKITDEDVAIDTRNVLSGVMIHVQIRDGMLGMDSPIFDRLAADYFASDKTTFNLGDYR
ncbi:hypothetical protein, partial [Clostridium baratii]|uniref:hypothetical protein n=1 Tax=Clostridium baratii TaxID=1561 RepID=UPI003D3477D0